MKYLSTFTGIGGFEVGITRVLPDAECIGYSEIDQPAIKTYEEHYEHTNYGDITTIDAGGLPDFDLICGGFPCQAFSIAGKRRGFDEARGTLFFDVARILADKRPRHLVLENVKGLLSHDGGKTVQTILRILTDLGYRIEWEVLNSKNFGVPQNRERIYIVGHLGDGCTGQIFPLGEGGGRDIQAQGRPQGEGERLRGDNSRVLAATLAVRDYKGGNNLIKQLNQPVHSRNRLYSAEGVSPTLNTAQGGGRQPYVQITEATKKGYAEATVGDTINISVPNSQTRRGRVQKGLAGTLQTGESMVTMVAMTETRTEEAKAIRRESQKQGRDFSPRRGKALVPRNDEIMNTVTANQGKEHFVTDAVRIRRLTPTECERLQGFADGWTIGSDTQRYKQCGNAVTTNVVEAVMTALHKEGCI